MSFSDKLKKRGNRKKIEKLVTNPPAINENKILFYASNDFSDNALALYEYMVETGMDKTYEIVWLVRDVEECIAKDPGNARFVYVKNDDLNMWTWEAQQEAMSARWLFFTHSLNWVKLKRPGQTFVNLWHGCGYKGRREDDKRTTYFDYCLITGEKYIDIQEKYFVCDRNKLLVTGYPRSDWFRTDKTNAANYIADIKKNSNSDKVVIWMPTYRQGKLGRLDDATSCGELGLPLVDTLENLDEINIRCRELGVVIVIKIHNLQKDYILSNASNIICISEDTLARERVNLFELMAKTDGMLTDYSSAAVDYMLLQKPIGYVLDDYDEYEKVRGFSFNNVKDYMPGNHIYKLDDLVTFLEDVSTNTDRKIEWRHKVNKEMNVESDCYSRMVLERLQMA